MRNRNFIQKMLLHFKVWHCAFAIPGAWETLCDKMFRIKLNLPGYLHHFF